MAPKTPSRFLPVVLLLAAVVAASCRSSDVRERPSPPGARPSAPATTQPTTERPAWLNAPAESHGARQLQRMLTDRPHMAIHVKPGDELLVWAVDSFEGTALGFPVYWDAEPPGAAAESKIPSGDSNAFVRVAPAKAAAGRAFELEWRGFIFEIHNLMNAAEYRTTFDAVLAGGLNRAEWMRRTTELEFRAVLRTRQFFRAWWDPWCRRNGLPRTPRDWFVGCGDTYEEWISRYTDPAGYPESFWGRYYDLVVLPYLALRRQAEEAGAASAGGK